MLDYRLGLEILYRQVDQTSRLTEFLSYKSTLLENLDHEELYGRTAVLAKERTETLVPSLDKLSLAVCGVSFTDLASGSLPVSHAASPRLHEVATELGAGRLPFAVPPPVRTRLQHLPFKELSPEQFEAVCFALIEAQSNTLHAEFYGVRGNRQDGIDIIAHHRIDGGGSEKWVYQCKRYQRYTVRLLEEALEEMTYPADYYVVMLSVDAPADLSDVVAKRTNTFLWDARYLARRLKNYPDLVDEFFGFEWREAFAGPR